MELYLLIQVDLILFKKRCLKHEIGHSLKLSHSDVNDINAYLDVSSIMRTGTDKDSTIITLYDKASLIKKWREMP